MSVSGGVSGVLHLQVVSWRLCWPELLMVVVAVDCASQCLNVTVAGVDPRLGMLLGTEQLFPFVDTWQL